MGSAQLCLLSLNICMSTVVEVEPGMHGSARFCVGAGGCVRLAVAKLVQLAHGVAALAGYAYSQPKP